MSFYIKQQGILAFIATTLLTALLGTLTAHLPVVSVIIYLFWAVPVIMLIRQQGLVSGVAALLSAGMIVAGALRSPTEGAIFLLQLAPVAVIIGLLLKNYVSTNKSLMVILVTAAVTEGVFLIIAKYTGGLDMGELRRQLLTGIDPYMSMLKQENALKALQEQGYTEAMIRQNLKATVEISIKLIPATMIIGSFMGMISNYIISNKALTRINSYQSPLRPFTLWQLPWYIIWLMIAGLALVLLSGDNSIWFTIGLNLMLIDGFISLILGLGVAFYYFPRLPLSTLFKTMMLLLMIFNLPVTVMIVLTMGLFDPALNFRRLDESGETKKEV